MNIVAAAKKKANKSIVGAIEKYRNETLHTFYQ